MKARIGIVAALVLALAACGGANDGGQTASEKDAYMGAPMAPPPAPMAAMDMPAAESARIVQEEPGGGQQGGQSGGQTGGQTGGDPADPAAARQIAYTYYYGFAVPTQQMEALLNTHKALCENAGPAACYVSNSSISGLGQDYASGSLQLRASREWMDAFLAGMAEGLTPFGASLSSSNTSAEDLTTRIIDTSATLESRKTLRTRLQQLLADRPGRLSDLLEIERELARVQQQIDSTESILAAMRHRVSMSTLTLSYEPRYSAVSESIWRPLGNAFSSFAPNIAQSLADIVNFISAILLWLIIIAVVVWLVVWRLGRKKKSETKAAPAPAAKT